MADQDPGAPEHAGTNRTDPDGTAVVLLVAHGSRNPRAAEAHEQLCARVQQRAERDGRSVPVRPAYLEISEPSIPDAIDAEVAAGAGVVRLLPHFLSPGNHVLVDLPAIAADARAHHPGVTIELAEYLGADDGLVDLLAARATS